MSSKINDEVMQRSYVLAKDIVPFDSGLLSLSMSNKKIENGFLIRYKGSIAKHGIILERSLFAGRSKKKTNKHRHFVRVKTVDAIIGLIASMKNGQFDEKGFAQTYKRVQEKPYTARTNLKMLQAIGGASLDTRKN
jgi:hypothetical protein